MPAKAQNACVIEATAFSLGSQAEKIANDQSKLTMQILSLGVLSLPLLGRPAEERAWSMDENVTCMHWKSLCFPT